MYVVIVVGRVSTVVGSGDDLVRGVAIGEALAWIDSAMSSTPNWNGKREV